MRRSARRRIKRRRRILAVGLVALLAGCSSIPNAINPVEWFKGARDFIVGSDDQPRATEDAPKGLRDGRGQAVPGAGKPIPNLNTVPRRPEPSSREQRSQTERGLISDREGARRYSRETVRRQGDPVNPLQTSPRRSPETSPQAKAPSATPRIETPRRRAAPTPRPRPPAAQAPAPTPPKPPPAASARQPSPKAAPAPRPAPQPRQAAPASGGEPETVVVSGAGVQTGGRASTSPPALSPGVSRPAFRARRFPRAPTRPPRSAVSRGSRNSARRRAGVPIRWRPSCSTTGRPA